MLSYQNITSVENEDTTLNDVSTNLYDGTIKSNCEQMTTLSNKNEKYVN